MSTTARVPKYTHCEATGCCNLLGPQYGKGAPQRWCSNQCRLLKYSVPCKDCGVPLTGSGGYSMAPERCRRCAGMHRSATSGRATLVLEMWRLRECEQLNNTAIAQRLGIARHSVAQELYRLRALGFAVPKSPYRGTQMRASAPRVVERSCASLERDLARMGIQPPDIGLPWRTTTTQETS